MQQKQHRQHDSSLEIPACAHQLLGAQQHAVQVAQQHENDRDRDQVALVELQLHAAGRTSRLN